MKARRENSGFTIVELVIVIAVIAILAAALVPTFSKIITKANESGAIQEAKSKYNELIAIDAADGVIDGKEGDDPLTGSDDKVLNTTDFAGCTYVPNKSFVYKVDSYTVTATLNISAEGNTWTVSEAKS